jgi:hypothetical protein
MNDNLRLLIGDQKWKELQRKNPDMKNLVYQAVCETCGIVFFEKPLEEVQRMLNEGEWDPHQPMMWYVEAGRHWVPQKFHDIRVYVLDKDPVSNQVRDRTLVRDESAVWTKDTKARNFTDVALLHGLDEIEAQIRHRCHQPTKQSEL